MRQDRRGRRPGAQRAVPARRRPGDGDSGRRGRHRDLRAVAAPHGAARARWPRSAGSCASGASSRPTTTTASGGALGSRASVCGVHGPGLRASKAPRDPERAAAVGEERARRADARSGLFRHLGEILLHTVEPCTAERWVGFAHTMAVVLPVLELGLSDDELGLDRVPGGRRAHARRQGPAMVRELSRPRGGEVNAVRLLARDRGRPRSERWRSAARVGCRSGGSARCARSCPIWTSSRCISACPTDHVLGHRGLSHSLLFAAVLASVVTAIVRRTRPAQPGDRGSGSYFFLATASHGLLDAMTTGGLGVAFFAPFSDARYFLPWRPIVVSPISISGVLRAGAVWR